MYLKETPKDVLYDFRYCNGCGSKHPNTLVCLKDCGLALCNSCLEELRLKIDSYQNFNEVNRHERN